MSATKLFLVLTLALAASCAPAQRRGKDVYPDFKALKAANTEGLDYSREIYARGSQTAIFAIHGGDIERATARVARSIAGKDFNLYIFNGWQGERSGGLHVTATRFNDPEAVSLATASVLGVSLHAQADRGSWVCVGGSNTQAAQLVAARLNTAGFMAETPCARLPGTSRENIANRPAAGGVQLELTLRLLARLENDEENLAKFSETVRTAVLEALQLAALNNNKENATK